MRLLPLAAALLIGACSFGSEGRDDSPAAAIAGIVPGLSGLVGQETADANAFPPGFGPQDLAENPSDFQLMWLPSFVAQAGLARIIQDNGRAETYESQYGFTAAFRDGMLVGTRGLPYDLMGASAEATRAAIRAGGGTAIRYHDTLNSLDQIEQARFECTIVANGPDTVSLGLREVVGRKYTETCVNRRVQFENLYWLDDSGDIMASRQFVSQTVAYLRSNRL